MNLLYLDVENEKNSWDYGDDVGYIPKTYGSDEKDREQDEKIAEIAQAILNNNERDNAQQSQIDANSQSIVENNSRDDAQQSQIDANKTALEENERIDTQQQSQIEENSAQIINNTTNITRIENELPTLEMEGTTLVIGKKGDS